MSLLFTIESKIVKPYTETLLISPFREIWERDTNAGKFTAIDEFTYIEFMTSVKKSNPYRGYTPEERAKRLAVDIMKHELYEPDELVKRGMEVLVEFQQTASPTYNYYMSAKKAIYKIQTFFDTFDLNETNEKTGMPLYKPKDVTTAVNDTEKVLQNLSTLQEKVDNELFETTKTKGQKIVSPFANPDTL